MPAAVGRGCCHGLGGRARVGRCCGCGAPSANGCRRRCLFGPVRRVCRRAGSRSGRSSIRTGRTAGRRRSRRTSVDGIGSRRPGIRCRVRGGCRSCRSATGISRSGQAGVSAGASRCARASVATSRATGTGLGRSGRRWVRRGIRVAGGIDVRNELDGHAEHVEDRLPHDRADAVTGIEVLEVFDIFRARKAQAQHGVVVERANGCRLRHEPR